MKKNNVLPLVIILALIGGSFWLLRSTDTKHVTRQEVIVDVKDSFEK